VQDTLSKSKRRHYTKSSSFFMALLFTVLCGAVALTLGYFINYFAKGHFVYAAEAVIDSEIRYLDISGTIPNINEVEERIYIPLRDNAHLPESFPMPSRRLAEGLLVFDMPDNKQYAARIHTMVDGHKVLVGTDITEIAGTFSFMQWIGIASIIFVMIVVFVSYIISIFVVNGTNKIAGTAQDIIRTGDLSRRVEVFSRWDDLSNMANTLNLLFDRIEELMRGVRQVSDNIAHDLRTPLTRMRSHIEELQKAEPDNTSYDMLITESDRILMTFNALLRISRIETEQQRSQFATLYLDEVIKDVIDFYEPLAEEKSITLIRAEFKPAPYHGDRDLLFQAFANILDNALKFTPQGGLIEITMARRGGSIYTEIENTGPPIDEQDIKRIFHRFYRADQSRNLPGAGLGLSMVRAVITLHEGSVSAQNTPRGVKIITIL